ncbi:flagellar hook-length control protein FliK [Roseovarius ramblicola]|uniref:Flagellar hook-length control protein FliK n=2 Tax=Roseovarius ramblicola TaxID=2022336 RepID=A0ABV5HW27_9RHOB
MAAASDPARPDPAVAAPDTRAALMLAGTAAPPDAAAAPGIPRQIALRIAQVAEGGAPRGTVEISLSPEELGRVRLRLHPSEAGLSVTVTADRPETLDLMRRNIDMLAREFLEIGYDGAQFAFAQDGAGAERDPDARGPGTAAAPDLAAAPGPAPPEAAAPVTVALLVPGERLDIRL